MRGWAVNTGHHHPGVRTAVSVLRFAEFGFEGAINVLLTLIEIVAQNFKVEASIT